MKNLIQIGIDVDAEYLVCQRQVNAKQTAKTFANTPVGHKKLVQWATSQGTETRVCMESTGVYSFLVALTLHHTPGVEVSVVNPRLIKNFAAARLQRGKTDAMDATTILEYAIRMPFVPWHPPRAEVLELQLLCRRILQLTTEERRERSRCHAALRMGDQGQFLVNDLEVNIRHIRRRITIVEQRIEQLIEATGELEERYRQLTSITGIAHKTGPRILAELVALPADMKARQWVAHAGLDPRPHESGTTIKPRRVSKQGNRYLRDALYLPALVASRRDKHVAAYYEQLIARGKKPKQALVAIMRKLLLAIWAMFQNRQNWDPEKFFKMA
ncbi:MAG: IS110 family transposase [Planctomycetales bacterium]|nr:IS110 family transposase [Planctomycetales bacterium]